MKKLVFSISLILSYTFIAIAGVVKSIPAKADDFTNGNIVTVSPSQDADNIQFGLTFLEYLRQGGSVDFTNVSNTYTVDNFIDDFNDLYNELVSDLPSPLDDVLANYQTNVKLSPNNKLRNYVNVFRNNLPSYLNNQDTPVEPTPNPNPDFSFIQNINNLYVPGTNINLTQYTGQYRFQYYNSEIYSPTYNLGNCTIVQYGGGFTNNRSHLPESTSIPYVYFCNPIITINVDTSDPNNVTCVYTATNKDFANFHNAGNTPLYGILFSTYSDNYVIINDATYSANNGLFRTSFDSLSTCMNYLYAYFCNINLYVDGIPWALAYGNQTQNYSIELGTGTYLQGTNNPIEYSFNIDVYFDLNDLIDKIDLAIENKLKVDFPDFSNLIVDTNGQQTFAVTVFSEDYTLDDLYIKDYGAMIPVFPLWVTYPVSLDHINTVATIGIVDVIPNDIIEVLGIFLIVGLFVFLCHRLME